MRIAGYASQFNAIRCEAIFRSIEVKNNDPNTTNHTLAVQVFEELKLKIRLCSPQSVEPLNFVTLQWPLSKLVAHCQQKFGHAVADLYKQMSDGLELGVRHKLVGKIKHGDLNPRVKEYCFYRHIIDRRKGETQSVVTEHPAGEQMVEDRNKGMWTRIRKRQRKVRHSTDFFQERRLGFHTHTLFDAEVLPLQRAKLKMPAWVKLVLDKVCPWMYPAMGIAAGSMARERILETELDRKEWTEINEEEQWLQEIVAEGRLWSPGLLFNDFVVLGWSDRDLS